MKNCLEKQKIINCGFGADNQGLQPASASVLFDRKSPRNLQQLIQIPVRSKTAKY